MKRIFFISFVLVSVMLLGSSLAAVKPKARSAAKPKVTTGTVTGLISIPGVGPMMDGTVFFHKRGPGPAPSPTKYWSVPTEYFKVDANARFTAVLPEGQYYLGAIERSSEEVLGPPQEGDYFLIYSTDKGKPKFITVKRNKVTDLGTLSQVAPFKQASVATKGITAVEGVIRNEQGAPVEGISVFAFASPSTVGKPLFISDKSDKDGKYRLRLAGGGKYYLRARVNFGGPPAADEPMGLYKDGKPGHARTGAVKKGFDIIVRPVGIPVAQP